LRRKDDREWWLEHLKELIEVKYNDNTINVNEIINNTGVNSYEKEEAYHTIKKLVIYKYYIDIYTKIIKNHFPSFYYFDLFAGAGTVSTTIGNEQLNLFGSALIAVLTPTNRFTKYIYVEKDKNNHASLNKLLRYIKDNYIKDLVYEVINADMNQIDRYSQLINECEHALVVIDPEGLEPEWSTIHKILTAKRVDMLMTFMTEGIQRVLGKAKNNQSDRDKLSIFLGKDIDPNNTNIEKFEEEYIKQLMSIDYVAVRTIEASSDRFSYDIIIATKKTKGGNPWLKHLKTLRPRLDVSDQTIKSIVMQLLGKSSTLDNYK